MQSWIAVAASVLVFAAPSAGVTVRVHDGRVDVQARSAPVSDVLDRLAEKTGMKVRYEAGRPQVAVTLELERRTPVEAVLATLEGLGIPYAFSTDRSGTRVETLIISASSAASLKPAPGATATRGDETIDAAPAPDAPEETLPSDEVLPPRPELMRPSTMTVRPDEGAGPAEGGLAGHPTNPSPPTVQEPLLPSYPSNPAPALPPPTIQQPLLPTYPSNPAPPSDHL